jgi:hypothetical protein
MNTTTEKQERQERDALMRKEFGSLIGKTVKDVRSLTRKECELFAWEYDYNYAFAIVFSDNTVAVPSADAEGNGAGYIFIEKQE